MPTHPNGGHTSMNVVIFSRTADKRWDLRLVGPPEHSVMPPPSPLAIRSMHCPRRRPSLGRCQRTPPGTGTRRGSCPPRRARRSPSTSPSTPRCSPSWTAATSGSSGSPIGAEEVAGLGIESPPPVAARSSCSLTKLSAGILPLCLDSPNEWLNYESNFQSPPSHRILPDRGFPTIILSRCVVLVAAVVVDSVQLSIGVLSLNSAGGVAGIQF